VSDNSTTGDFFKDKPRESIQAVLLALFAICNLWAAVAGFTLFLFFGRGLKVTWWKTLIVGVAALFISILYLQIIPYGTVDFKLFIKHAATLNFDSLRAMIQGDFSFFFSGEELAYIGGISLFLMSLLNLAEMIPASAHEKALKKLHSGNFEDSSDLPQIKLTALLDKLKEEKHDGTLLGVLKSTGQPAFLSDQYVNEVVTVFGTTGSGKTITLRRFLSRSIKAGYPTIFIDGKPTDENINWVKALAEKTGRPFYGFNCGNFMGYDPFSDGGFTELKDKIMSLKDDWSSDHYKSIAGDYLQAVFEVIFKLGKAPDLKTVVDCLDYNQLALLLRKTKDKEFIERMDRIESDYSADDIKGLRAHLNTLVYSEFGRYFDANAKRFSLSQAIGENAVVYFALPALRFPEFSAVLGKLVINDLKTAIDRNDGVKKVFTVFDEFSIFAGKQVLNLVNMGRGKGVHAVFGTQGVSDLRTVSPDFQDQILNCTNTIICHRVNDQTSAETIATWAGTKKEFDVTAQVTAGNSSASMGSVSLNRSFNVHPDAIKQELLKGEAFIVTKIPNFQCHKIRVLYS